MNILLIMVDQLRNDYLGYNGAEHVNTPHIDSLAHKGIVFKKCFTNSPICAPARISLATGQRPWRLGALDNDVALPLNTPTYYQALRDHGYHVACVGKLDLNKPDMNNGHRGQHPYLYNYGFTHPFEVEGKMHASSSITPQGPYTDYLSKKNLLETFYNHRKEHKSKGFFENLTAYSPLETQDYADVFVTKQAVHTLKNMDKDYPWHLFISFPGPHDPFDPPKEYSDLYTNTPMPKSLEWRETRAPWVHKRQVVLDEKKVKKIRQQYCAYIELIDDQIGKILDTLESLNEIDNTYIIFTSDHGEMLGDYSLYNKHVPYESAINVPLIVAGPNIQPGHSEVLVELMDINPTIQNLAGVEQSYKMDALSLYQHLFKDLSHHRSYTITEERHFRCIRTDKYKYIQHYNYEDELYDLIIDPHEENNIINYNPKEKVFLSHQLRSIYGLQN